MEQATTQALVRIAQDAGAAIMEIYGTDFAVEHKDDASPLTQADLAAHRIIVAGLGELTPDIPILSEESVAAGFAERAQWTRYWLVDPLDGTKEFVNRNGEFTVNIALISEHEPVFGVVDVPVQKRTFVGDVEAGQAFVLVADGARQTLSGLARHGTDEPLTVVASRSHGGERLEDYLGALAETFGTLSRTSLGSSLKLCALAAGEADFYPRLGPTSEWDIAAAHAVLRAAGGDVCTFDGATLRYNTKESLLNPDFYAVADRSFAWQDVLPTV